MKKIINLGQKPKVEYFCQVCHKNEAMLQIKGSGWLHHIQGKFCEPCAIKKIKYWYRKDTPKNGEPDLFCENCGRWRNQKWENDRILRELDLQDLLNEVARRMKENTN